MKLGIVKNLLVGKPKRPTRLLAITPPRRKKRSPRGVEDLLGSIAVPEPLSPETVSDAEGVSLLARFREGYYGEQRRAFTNPSRSIGRLTFGESPL